MAEKILTVQNFFTKLKSIFNTDVADIVQSSWYTANNTKACTAHIFINALRGVFNNGSIQNTTSLKDQIISDDFCNLMLAHLSKKENLKIGLDVLANIHQGAGSYITTQPVQINYILQGGGARGTDGTSGTNGYTWVKDNCTHNCWTEWWGNRTKRSTSTISEWGSNGKVGTNGASGIGMPDWYSSRLVKKGASIVVTRSETTAYNGGSVTLTVSHFDSTSGNKITESITATGGTWLTAAPSPYTKTFLETSVPFVVLGNGGAGGAAGTAGYGTRPATAGGAGSSGGGVSSHVVVYG